MKTATPAKAVMMPATMVTSSAMAAALVLMPMVLAGWLNRQNESAAMAIRAIITPALAMPLPSDLPRAAWSIGGADWGDEGLGVAGEVMA